MTIEGDDAHPRAAVHRSRHTEPDRVRGHLSAPEAQLDRFVLRIGVGYPARDHEWEMLERRLERAEEEVELDQVTEAEDAARDAAGARARYTSRRASATTSSTSSPRVVPHAGFRSGPALVGRSPC